MPYADETKFQMFVNNVPWAGGDDGLTLAHFSEHFPMLLTAFFLAHPTIGNVRDVKLVMRQEPHDESYLTSDDTLNLLRAMKRWGGSFSSELAEAWLYADLDNRRALEREFRPMLESFRRFL
jgi:hypothetical protein